MKSSISQCLLSPLRFKEMSSMHEEVNKQFDSEGIVYLQNFFSPEELKKIHKEILFAEEHALEDLKKNWASKKITFFTKKNVEDTESTKDENYVVTPYFQRSIDSTHIFFEEINDKLVVNRIGHGLHLDQKLATIHQTIYSNENLNQLLKSVGYIRPICLMSLYIPKHPQGFGSEVRPHQESTFAHTNPLSSSVLWIALEDATIENACMWGLLKSHQLPLKYLSKVDHQNKVRIYEQINDADIPDFNTDENIYTPLEVKAGDALFFDGNFVHCSPVNNSENSRKALSFQFVETHKTEFSSFNWVKTPNNKAIYEV